MNTKKRDKSRNRKSRLGNPDISVDTVFRKDYFMRKACYTVIGDEYLSIDI
jgi:hypothetical protein